MKRGLTPTELDAIKFEVYDFAGEWMEAFDQPEITGVWFIWGHSGNGKTSFVLKLIKYLTTFRKKVIYNSLEEGRRKTMQNAFRRAMMKEVTGRVLLVQESIEQSTVRLKKRGSADVLVIDSFQYANLSFKQYLAFKRLHPNKLIIIISQAEGKMPKGRAAKDVMFDADLKVWVEGHRAISKGRYIGMKGYYTNWIKGAARYWGQGALEEYEYIN
ncbi:MAG: ATP-binding protein [Candidatus Pedobacter colombiensis]|uniref:ATP-binding protein n=1 Tax=Candidatus Pedobacter colombiensis TaxID=3121371 RepID=A0AAJ5W522_9SPHI|nr:ATP-binding protein [Pedobacter sp.]WEK18189.1 MAG: ATP-binding protein [Pedobacter sp.]